MNEIEFKLWLMKSGIAKKVQSDCISRLRKIEKELNHCDIDNQYRIDKCEHLMNVFSNMGNNDEMKKYPNANFPVGKYHMSTYRYAIKRYVQFLESK